MKPAVLLLSCSLFTLPALANLNPDQPLSPVPPMAIFEGWARPIAPFQIASNIWYVGTENLSSVLFTTPEGHVLIDAAMDSSAGQIKANIETLGFRVADIRFLLNSHARLDQAGGLARMKRWSRAALLASADSAKQLARGGKADFALGDALPFPPVVADRIIDSNSSLQLGGMTFTALMTPGHLPGSTSWRVRLPNGQTLIYADSLATPDYLLVNNKNYPTLVSDIRHSFTLLSQQHVDIFLASKGERFQLEDKRRRLAAGDKNAFIDPQGLQRYVQGAQQAFETQLSKQLNQ